MKKENDLPSEIEKDLYPKTCFLSNFPPKECGIATFTKNLSTAMDKRFNPKLKSKVIAINDEGNFYNYNKKVIMEITKNDIETYIDIAKKVNEAENIKIVCIQHEFGIFGGKEINGKRTGDYLLEFINHLKKPIVTTCHTALEAPLNEEDVPIFDERKKILAEILSKSSKIIAISNTAKKIFLDYGIKSEKIEVILHGTHKFDESPKHSKEILGLENKFVMSMVGLVRRKRGMEYVIQLERTPHKTDTIFEGQISVDDDILRFVLVIDPKSLMYIEGTEIDWEIVNLSPKMVFRNPQAQSSCSCGLSFDPRIKI